MFPQPLITADGSYTLINPANGVHYRSRCGAISESRYVFLEQGRLLQQTSSGRVLELGLGGCLNFLVTATAWLQQNPTAKLYYHVVESEPITPDILQALHYEQLLDCEPLLNELALVLSQLSGRTVPLQATLGQAQIELVVYPTPWRATALPPDLQVDAIYHDPFGPRDNPECWGAECFQWSSRHLTHTGRLVTYAAATSVRRAMVAAGLFIASAPGFARKREMTLAAHSSIALRPERVLK